MPQTESELARLIREIKSVLAMNPPPEKVRTYGGAVITGECIRSIGVTADQLREAATAAGLTMNQSSDWYVISPPGRRT